MLSVADELLFMPWQHRHQKIKVRREKEFLHTRIFRPDILYSGQIIRVPEETAKDLVERGCASPRWGAGYLVRDFISGPDYSLPGYFAKDKSVRAPDMGVDYWADSPPP
jgi:hypothetical protein